MAKALTQTVPTDPVEAGKILERARKGDESVLPAVREIRKDAGAVDRLGGDLARQAEQALIRAATGEDVVFREALIRKLDLMRADLAGPVPAPLDRLLVDRVVACWLQLHYADAMYAQARGATLPQDAAAQRRQNAAQTRYLQAVRALAQLRKLLRPAVSPVDLALRPFAEARPGAGRLSERPRLAPVGEAVAN